MSALLQSRYSVFAEIISRASGKSLPDVRGTHRNGCAAACCFVSSDTDVRPLDPFMSFWLRLAQKKETVRISISHIKRISLNRFGLAAGWPGGSVLARPRKVVERLQRASTGRAHTGSTSAPERSAAFSGCR